jgi:DNA-binding transcriptional regulator YiaG
MSNYNKVFLEYLFEKATNKERMEPLRIKSIRKFYKLTQLAFSDFIMINYETYKSWELGRREPSTPGYAILTIAEKYPEIFLEHRKKILNDINGKSNE